MHRKKRNFGIRRTRNLEMDSDDPFNRHSRILESQFKDGEIITCILVREDYMLTWKLKDIAECIDYLNLLPENPTHLEFENWKSAALLKGYWDNFTNVSIIQVLETQKFYKVLGTYFTRTPTKYKIKNVFLYGKLFPEFNIII